MWGLARDSGTLDLNSPYAYLLFAHYFADSCAIAETEQGAAGFVLGFRPPAQQDTLFVWQITIAAQYRGARLGVELLSALLEWLAPQGVRYLEATVTPSNEASARMFRSLAQRLDAPFVEGPAPLFPRELFPDGTHEEERGIRIGPFYSITSTDRETIASTAVT